MKLPYYSLIQLKLIYIYFFQYHVQFYGKVQRAWVKEQSLLKFEGLDAFNEAGLKVKASGSKKSSDHKKKLLSAYFPSGDRKTTWQEAVEGNKNL